MPVSQFKLYLLIVIFSLIHVPAIAASHPQNTDINALLFQAKEKRLAEHTFWKGLLHYKKPGGTPYGVESEIISPNFFQASEGRHDPEAEMQATLRSFFLPPPANHDDHSQCRFIARFHWLKENLDWKGFHPPEVRCNSFDSWVKLDKVRSLSLIFATGYLSSPASFYGHILLKVNSLNDSPQTDLLNQSVNYGAIVPENEVALVYVYRGLFGGYEAGFSQDVFYRHNHNYVENELRDLWEYELNLSKDQREAVLYHAWELLGTKFKYFFLDENCAYHMANLLDLVIEEDVNYEHDVFSLPIDLFNRLDNINNLGTPVIRNVKRIPSRQNRLIDHMKGLSSSQQNLVRASTEKPLMNLLSTLPIEDQIKIVETLLEYYEFRVIADKDPSFAKQKKHELLVLRTALPISSNDKPINGDRNQPPTKGPLPRMTRFGWEQNDAIGAGISIGSRFSYYDLLDLESGRPPATQLTAFELKISAHHDELIFRTFDFLHVQNLNISRTGLPGEGGIAWNMRVFIENHDLDCNHCGDFNISGGIGKGMYVLPETVLFAMGDFNLRLPSLHDSFLTFTPRIGLLGSPASQWRSSLTIGYQYNLGDDEKPVKRIDWSNRFGTKREWDIRINYRLLEYKEISALLSLYW